MTQTDLDIPYLLRALDGRLVGREVLYYEELESTMDEARRLAEDGRPEGTVVVAETQTAARGRFQRAWVSPVGQNLTFSVLLRPSSEQLRYSNMAATLAVSEAIQRVAGLNSHIKWPNDVRIDGRKISGILIETSIEMARVKHAVVGIGVNVNLDPSEFPEISAVATSILRETGSRTDRTRVLQATLEEFDDLYRAVKTGQSLTDRWAAKLETLGRIVRVQWNSHVVEGKARGVDEEGNLVVARPDGSTVTVTAGEVTLQE